MPTNDFLSRPKFDKNSFGLDARVKNIDQVLAYVPSWEKQTPSRKIFKILTIFRLWPFLKTYSDQEDERDWRVNPR